ncbi:hypothetical protein KIN20_007083 [Parelaphostrongylus tenuis]|uniref:Uncharacterized protein n=1 Tax=Parelaphostrongylus tenuis TaxID=148309 RepID=A0AAD5QJR8_PARTN|nr:hypothetical protein KIN20_007083 [Parelaphostrongylus tenuis]
MDIVVVVSSILAEDAGNAHNGKRSFVSLNSEAETGPTEKASKTTFADLGISSDDIEDVIEDSVPSPPAHLTPGDEYVPEKPSPTSDEHVELTYQQSVEIS